MIPLVRYLRQESQPVRVVVFNIKCKLTIWIAGFTCCFIRHTSSMALGTAMLLSLAITLLQSNVSQQILDKFLRLKRSPDFSSSATTRLMFCFFSQMCQELLAGFPRGWSLMTLLISDFSNSVTQRSKCSLIQLGIATSSGCFGTKSCTDIHDPHESRWL